jgi:hypothetical protein
MQHLATSHECTDVDGDDYGRDSTPTIRISHTATTRPAPAMVKTCACGHSYTEEQWDELEPRGVQDCGDGTGLDLRNCVACSSTIGIPVVCIPKLRPLTGSSLLASAGLGLPM